MDRLPELIIDANDHAEAKELPITATLPVGSHLNVPLRLSDGSVYGSFCCLSHQPDRTLTPRDLATLRAFAALAVEQIESELGEASERREQAARIAESDRAGPARHGLPADPPARRRPPGRSRGARPLSRPGRADARPLVRGSRSGRPRHRAGDARRPPGDPRPAVHPGRALRRGQRLAGDRLVARSGEGDRRRARRPPGRRGDRAQQDRRSSRFLRRDRAPPPSCAGSRSTMSAPAIRACAGSST